MTVLDGRVECTLVSHRCAAKVNDCNSATVAFGTATCFRRTGAPDCVPLRLNFIERKKGAAMSKLKMLGNCRYAAVVWMLVLLASFTANGGGQVSFQSMLSFNNAYAPEGNFDNGFTGPSTLVQGRDGDLYGATEAGGAYSSGFGCGYATGTAFKMTPLDELTTLHRFHQCLHSADGQYPQSGLVLASNGALYGTTVHGGSNVGTVFKLSGTTLTTFNFLHPTLDGDQPVAGLVQAADGYLYGTTNAGGANGCGTVFKMSETGAITPLYSFPAVPYCGYGDWGRIIQGSDGNLYGTVWASGAYAYGSIFKINLQGQVSILHSFQGGLDGLNPGAGLVEGADGDFYGTTEGGGVNNGGTIFKITREGVKTVLFDHFGTPAVVGSGPNSLILASDGNFYGTTKTGGPQCSASTTCGTIFMMTPEGGVRTIHVFDGTHGWRPAGGLVQYTDGSFYGMTSRGGGSLNCAPYSCGTIYHLTISGMAPFVQSVEASGRAGQVITILGNELSGTTEVLFNGVPARFVVYGNTYLTAIVPTGAETGFITVNTRTGILTSNRQFEVVR